MMYIHKESCGSKFVNGVSSRDLMAKESGDGGCPTDREQFYWDQTYEKDVRVTEGTKEVVWRCEQEVMEDDPEWENG